jgi:hypothetical protein
MKNLKLALALSSLILTAPAMASQNGNWRYLENVDLMSDEDKSAVYTAKEKETIVVRCDGNNGFDVIIRPDEYIGSDPAPVAWRIDGGDIQNSRMGLSTQGTAAFVPGSIKAEFANSLRNASEIVIRVTDFRGTPITFVIDVTGANEAFSQLSCM